MNEEFTIPEQFNAANYFIDRHIAEGRGEKVAIACGDQNVTYRELFDAVNRIGNGLARYGTAKGDRVLVLLPDGPEFIISFFGAIKMGAIPVPLNTFLFAEDYVHPFEDSGAEILITDQALLEKISAKAGDAMRRFRHVIVVGSETKENSFEGFLAENSSALETCVTSRTDPALWLYSSGSTGMPKACVHLQRDMAVCAEHYGKKGLGIQEDDRFFSVSKLFFAYGLGNSLFLPLAVGATVILVPERMKPETILETIERYRPTLFFSVPTNYLALLACERKSNGKDYDLSSVRHATSAGETLPVGIFDRFRQRFSIEILDSIGATECFAFTTNRPGHVRPGSSGEAVPGYEIKIIGDDGAPAPAGTQGTLFVRSDSVFAYYWNQPEKTKATLNDGWCRTGDCCSMDTDGYLWHIGRIDDMFKSKGMWVSPVAVERVLAEHPAVSEVGVVGSKDENELTQPMAYVVLREKYSRTPELVESIMDLAKSRLPEYQCPAFITFIEQLPKTATGKLQRFKLKEIAPAPAAAPVEI